MATAKKSTRHASAIKAARQSLRHLGRNRFAKKGLRLASRAALGSVAAKDAAKTAELVASAASAIDKAAKSGAIHWKAAARKKSRLVRRVAAQLAAPAAPAKA